MSNVVKLEQKQSSSVLVIVAMVSKERHRLGSRKDFSMISSLKLAWSLWDEVESENCRGVKAHHKATQWCITIKAIQMRLELQLYIGLHICLTSTILNKSQLTFASCGQGSTAFWPRGRRSLGHVGGAFGSKIQQGTFLGFLAGKEDTSPRSWDIYLVKLCQVSIFSTCLNCGSWELPQGDLT